MYVRGIDTKVLIENIDDRIEYGLEVNRQNLGVLLGLRIDECYDSATWSALRDLIYEMNKVCRTKLDDLACDIKEAPIDTNDHKHRTEDANSSPTYDVKDEKDTEDHFTYDDITYPIHYAGNNKITCKDALNSMMSPLEAVITPKIGYWLGCAFKYLWRAFLKGDPKKDLKKCKQCINEMLNLM